MAGEEEGGARAEARVELALRRGPWRPRQVTCWGVGLCGILPAGPLLTPGRPDPARLDPLQVAGQAEVKLWRLLKG